MSAAAYYNEIDPFAAQWLRNLIAAGHIAPGEVDERSIEDVTPDDLRGFTQCHFSPGSASGPIPSASPDGLTIARCGLAPARASLSARQAKEMGLLTSGTFGPTSSISSASADLSMSLANRLQQVTQTYGSTLYKLTRRNGIRLRACAVYVSGHRRAAHQRAGLLRPTPVVGDMTGGPRPPDKKRGPAPGLQSASALAGWVTPTSRDWKDSAGMTAQRDGKERLDQMPRQAFMTGWPTPTTSNTRSPSVDAAMNTYRQDGSKTQQRLQDFAGITGPLRLTVLARCGLALMSRWEMASS